ncbi:adenine deaminase [Clostridium pascui]|uniref:adenine deaminase n=1 Tax=Clostridium pascui TaxID=46609 RepID=UPI00195681AE|nr:adenine deaminase [Clostridium pascui]MBM7870968.1 adenine deaminase [Clostridium pascui]
MLESMKSNIKIAARREKAPLVLKNAFFLNVFTREFERGDIAMNNGIIAGIGSYEGIEEIDCDGLFVTPGFIDAHVHIESSKSIPEIFSQVLLQNGVTTCITDPHEIANVLGEKGLDFMMENSKKSLMDIFYMIPSCVPATEFEDNGALLRSEDIESYRDRENVIGLAEVMDVPSVINCTEWILKKINMYKDKTIDGHCPQISEEWLNAYIAAGVKTDHECSDAMQALEKVKKGMYVMIREGSAAKNLLSLLPAVNEKNYSRFLFCTDDKDIGDLIEKGSINENIKISIEYGLNEIIAYTIASYNAAQCYNLKDRGAIAPGYKADLVILSDLKKVTIDKVIKSGRVYNYKFDFKGINPNLKNSINMDVVTEESFKIKAKSSKINIIKVIENSIETKKEEREVIIQNGYVNRVKGEDILKIAVFERHKNTGKYSLGYIEGLGLTECSVAQTIAHDSHNVIVVGSLDSDMTIAVNRLIEIGGGIVLVSNGKVIEELELPIAGLMTYKEPSYVINKLSNMNSFIKAHEKYEDKDIFLTLGFMALPVIPELKITARGLFYFKDYRFIDLFC